MTQPLGTISAASAAEPARTNRPRVLICDPIHPGGAALLRKHAHVDEVEGAKLSESELTERIGSYHAVINRSRTGIPASVIEAGAHLRIIARAGVGLDNIDVAAAEECGIQVVNAPDANTVAVAEHTFALMLSLARHISRADASMKSGDWEKSNLMGTGLSGRTLGIIGFGHIGRAVAKRATAFDMRVIVNQTRWTRELAQEWRVENMDLLDLLKQADFVSVHVPMRPSNVGLLSSKHFALMKPSAYVINTSRGGIVDEEALLHALNEGEIAGAGLDVFENEPNYRSELAAHPHVIATPHIAASTEDAQRKVALDVAEKVLGVLRQQSVADAMALRVLPSENVHPHEAFNPARVQRLANSLAEDGVLANPPLVAELSDGENYVVLDGATRSTVFKQLDYPHIVAQVVDIDHDNVQLFSWNHAVTGCTLRALLDFVRGIDGLHLVERDVEKLRQSMRERGAIGYMITADERGFLLELDEGARGSEAHEDTDWLNVLNMLVDGYGELGEVERTLSTNIAQVRAMYPELAALVVFPAFTTDVVLQMAGHGRLLPAGITRFVIPGRILRLNVPLNVLRSSEPLSIKRDWLDRFVQEKLSKRQVRYYEEPIVLLDE